MRAPSASARRARVSTRTCARTADARTADARSGKRARSDPGRGTGCWSRAAHEAGRPARSLLPFLCRRGDSATSTWKADGWDTAESPRGSSTRTHTRVSPNVHLGSRLRSHMTCHDRLLPRVPTARRVCAVALCSEGHVQCRWPQRSGRVWPRSCRGAHAEADASVVAACPDPARPPRPQHCPWHTCVLSAALRDTSRVSYDMN